MREVGVVRGDNGLGAWVAGLVTLALGACAGDDIVRVNALAPTEPVPSGADASAAPSSGNGGEAGSRRPSPTASPEEQTADAGTGDGDAGPPVTVDGPPATPTDAAPPARESWKVLVSLGPPAVAPKCAFISAPEGTNSLLDDVGAHLGLEGELSGDGRELRLGGAVFRATQGGYRRTFECELGLPRSWRFEETLGPGRLGTQPGVTEVTYRYRECEMLANGLCQPEVEPCTISAELQLSLSPRGAGEPSAPTAPAVDAGARPTFEAAIVTGEETCRPVDSLDP